MRSSGWEPNPIELVPVYPYKNRRDTGCTYEQRRVHLRTQQERSCLQQGEKVLAAQSCPTPCNPMDYTDQNTRVGSLSLLQGTFPTQGSNPGLPHCRWILYQLSHRGSPRILEWVAYPFSSGSSQPRNQTGVSCIAERFFTSWATREAQVKQNIVQIW